MYNRTQRYTNVKSSILYLNNKYKGHYADKNQSYNFEFKYNIIMT